MGRNVVPLERTTSSHQELVCPSTMQPMPRRKGVRRGKRRQRVAAAAGTVARRISRKTAEICGKPRRFRVRNADWFARTWRRSIAGSPSFTQVNRRSVGDREFGDECTVKTSSQRIRCEEVRESRDRFSVARHRNQEQRLFGQLQRTISYPPHAGRRKVSRCKKNFYVDCDLFVDGLAINFERS